MTDIIMNNILFALLLLDRKNTKESQRNLYVTASLSTKRNDEFYYGIHGDWETRRYFKSFSMLDKRTNQKDYTENELQMGIAPYLGEYNNYMDNA